MNRNPNEQYPLWEAAEALLIHAPRPKPRPAKVLLHELQVHQIELEMQNEQLRQAQNELEASRDFFKDFYDFSPVGYLTLDHSGMISKINLTGAALLGEERGKLKRKRFVTFVSPEDRDRWNHIFIHTLKCDDTQSHDIALQSANGSRFFGLLNIQHLKKEGEDHTVRVVLTDITEFRAVGDALDESIRFFTTLAQVSPVGIFRTDVQGNCVYVNERWCEIAGMKYNDVMGTGWGQAIHPDDREKVSQAWYTSAQTNNHFLMEYRFRRPDGVTRWMQGEAMAELDKAGEVIGYVGTITDITDSKQAEQVLRTGRELKEKQDTMRELSSHLQAAREEEKAHFAREIHDDLSGLLVGIKLEAFSLAEELAANASPAQLLKHTELIAEFVDTAANSMRRIISDLRPAMLDELGLMAALECYIAQFNKNTGIKCQLDYMLDNDDEKKLYVMQSTHLYRIMQEALTNVKKHSHATKVALEVHGDDEIITMSISDNGCGIPENHVVRSDSYGLLGMKERVEQQGGKLSFSKPHGGGFSVTVQLPLSAPPPSTSSLPEVTRGWNKAMKALCATGNAMGSYSFGVSFGET